MKYNLNKIIKCYGGSSGGGGGTTPKYSPAQEAFIAKASAAANAAYDSGALSQVAGTNPNLDWAFGTGADTIKNTAATSLGRLTGQQDRLTGTATTGGRPELERALDLNLRKISSGASLAGGGTGMLGSARGMLAETVARGDTIASNEQAILDNKLKAEAGLGSSVNMSNTVASGSAAAVGALGDKARSIEQQQKDATWQGVQRLASTMYGAPTTQQQSSGGK
jgi:hypothetical protein